jgi:hypothetical protein
MYRLRLAWRWLMANVWALWAAVFLMIALLWLKTTRRKQTYSAPSDPAIPITLTIWEEAAAFGAEEARWHRDQRDQILETRAHDLSKIEVKEAQLDEIKLHDDTSKRTEEMATWLEKNL